MPSEVVDATIQGARAGAQGGTHAQELSDIGLGPCFSEPPQRWTKEEGSCKQETG